jgi:hypothetical protein
MKRAVNLLAVLGLAAVGAACRDQPPQNSGTTTIVFWSPSPPWSVVVRAPRLGWGDPQCGDPGESALGNSLDVGL